MLLSFKVQGNNSVAPTMRQWRVPVLLVAVWLCVVLFITRTVPPDLDEANRVDSNVSRLQQELRTLYQRNIELQKQVAESRNNVLQEPCPENKMAELPPSRLTSQLKEYSSNGLTYELEHARRKAENTVTELWYFIDSLLKKSDTEEGHAPPKLSELRDSLEGYKRTMLADFDKLRKANNADVYREQRLQEVGDLVQRRLEYLQNPVDCSAAKKVICDLGVQCGFGCQLHHVVYCLITAYALERTLVLNSFGWRYAHTGWETVFEPLSKTCDLETVKGKSTLWKVSLEYVSSYDNIHLPSINDLQPRLEFLPLAVPADLAPELSILHGNPSVWWIGQILRYLFRPKVDVLREVKCRGEKIGFINRIVGVHVRRTDKVGVEADFHPLEEYMYHVKAYYDQLEEEQPGIMRRVYLATDDPDVVSEAQKKYPTYEFVNDLNSTQSAVLKHRYTESSLQGVITDVYYLARCDYLVCTFSSQICRLAYEIMQTLHGDASRSFQSLDDMYYFGGQLAHDLTAVEAHRSSKEGHIDLLPGDVIGIAGNHWNGFSKGLNRRTKKLGLFPSYKAEDTVKTADMPTYPKAPLKIH